MKRERARVARATAKVMRVAGDEEGEDGKQLRWQQGWRVSGL
jgi:hypothetical protein